MPNSRTSASIASSRSAARPASTVLLEIAGKDLEDVKTLHFDHPGLKAEFVKPNQFRVSIAADTPTGTYDVRAVGKYGISGSRLFAVSHGLTEIKEAEPNDSPDKAQAVPMNAAINGTSDNNGDDFYRFPARKGERVTIDCQAYRLDSTLRASMVLSTRDGKQLAQGKAYYDRTDPFLDYTFAEEGEYLLRLYDATFSGGLPYRLIISNRPHIENVFPPAVVPGETTELTVFGRNLPGGKPDPDAVVLDLPLDRLTVPFTAPQDPAALLRFDFINHPPTASTTLRGLHAFPRGLDNALDPALLVYAPHPVTKEQEPNDALERAQPLTLPTVLCGRFDKPGDADWYSFHLKAGEAIELSLYCERMDMPGDPFLIITDAQGKELASLDDFGINFNALAQFHRDPVGTFTAPAEGSYRLLIQERYGRGGPRFLYAVRIGKPEPDFYPVVIHETNPDPSCPVVRRGGSAFYEVCLNRRNFSGPVTIEAEGLPAGVTCPPVHVSPQTEFANVVFTAAADAPEVVGCSPAEGVGDGRRQTHRARSAVLSAALGDREHQHVTSVSRDLPGGARAGAYGLKTSAAPLTVAAGGTLETTVAVERHWPSFKAKLQLNGLNLPPGFNLAATELPADKKEIGIKLSVAANVPPGTYSVVLRGDAQVPFGKDPAGAKPNVRVADPCTPLTVVVSAPLKK